MSIQLNLKFDEAIARVKEVCNGALKDMAENTAGIAKSEHPWHNQTGTNAASVTWDEENGVFRVYTQSGYGGYLEIGTTDMPAYPYIYPAYEQSKKELDKLKGSV